MTKEEAIEHNDLYNEEYVLREDSNDFIKKQRYSEGVTKTVECKCGSDYWLVGSDDYLTVLKCKKCGNEFVIHDG